MNMVQFCTAKALTPAHPDKLASLIADRMLDACMANDPMARVDCRVQIAQKEILVFGEIASLSMPKVRETAAMALRSVGLLPSDYTIRTAIHQRAPGIASKDELCIVNGYAYDETSELLPMPVILAERLTAGIGYACAEGEIEGLFPGGQAMVTVEYDENGKPLRLEHASIVLQHSGKLPDEKVRRRAAEQIIQPALTLLPPDEQSQLFVTILPPKVQFRVSVSEPLSGKSPDNMERSGNLMARYIAKNLVAAGLASQCQVTLAYAVGIAKPVMVTVNSFGTGKICADDCLADVVRQVFKLEKHQVIAELKLREPQYGDALLGRRQSLWERTDKVKELQDAVL